MFSAGAGFISSGASAVGASVGKAVAARTGSRIAGNLAGKAAKEGTKYTASLVATNGNITEATKYYAFGKAVGALNKKPVSPTSNNKAVKGAIESAKSKGKTLSAQQKQAIRIENSMARKNVTKTNKSIKRENAVINSTLDVTYNTKRYYDEKRKR
jgi:hypothetical protein